MRYIFLVFVLSVPPALAAGMPWEGPGCEYLALSERAIGAVCADYDTFSSGRLRIYYRGPLWEKLRADPVSYGKFDAVLNVDGQERVVALTRRVFTRNGNWMNVNYGESIQSGEVLYGEIPMETLPSGQSVHLVFKALRRDLNPGWLVDKSHLSGYACRIARPTPARCLGMAFTAAHAVLAKQFDLLLAQ